MANELVHSAAVQAAATTRRGLQERLFARLFEGLVYAQIWEDPEIDLEALELAPGSRMVAIASGGCNVMSYLLARPERILAVDLNPAHLAILSLRLAAARELPEHRQFHELLAVPNRPGNLATYARLAPHLTPGARAWWEARDLLGRQRTRMLSRNLYAHGLLGRTIQLAHLLCRLHGRDLGRLLAARTVPEQCAAFEAEIEPVLRSPLVRALLRLPIAYQGLGIPPAQFAAMLEGSGGDVVQLVRERLQRLACGTPVESNWFAWAAFARRYPESDAALPPYLREGNYPQLREPAERVELHQANLTELLERQPSASLDAYVLLDAQDWMSAEQITALWVQVNRTARPGARVIFRTAAAPSPLPAMLPPDLLQPWAYQQARSEALHARDRSAIYGGFHLYRLEA